MSAKYILIFCDEKLNHEIYLSKGIIKYFPDTEKDTKAEVNALRLVDIDQIPQELNSPPYLYENQNEHKTIKKASQPNETYRTTIYKISWED
jgi:hypothetical protein